MRTNQQTYHRAVVASVFGFALHLLLTVVVFLLGHFLKDDATVAVAYFLAAGLPVWIALIVVYHQHKLERIEALEHEQLRTRAEASGSIFEFDDADSLAHANRLRWMHRFLVPAISLATAAAWIGLGLWQRSVLAPRLGDPADLQVGQTAVYRIADASSAGYGAGFAAAIAVVAFIVSWYLGGMSRHPAWRMLRGGASVMVGVALANAALAVGYGFQIAQNPAVLRVLGHAIPIVMVLLGIEILILFVLNLYTPRKPGEFPQPAFDSRVLGMLAAPESVIKSINDAINYQFGFSVTSTWFYQLLSRQLLPLAGVAVLLLVALNCLAVVQPHERAILTSFGRIQRGGQVFGSGPIVKWPWEKVERYQVAHVQQVTVGSESKADAKTILWDDEHATGQEELIIVGPTQFARLSDAGDEARIPTTAPADAQSASFARNYALLNAEVPVQFRIKDGADANGRPQLLNHIDFVGGRDTALGVIVRQIATMVVNRHLASMSIDEVLGPARSHLPDELRRLIQKELDARNAGIEVVFVGVAGLHPPTKVAESFEKVLQARENRETAIEEALSDAIRRLAGAAGSEARARTLATEIASLQRLSPEDPGYVEQALKVEQALLAAGGSAAQGLFEAKADRWVTHLDKYAQAVRQSSMMRPYHAAPELYRWREYLNTLTRALQGRRLVIAPEGVKVRATVNLEEDPTMLDLGSAISGSDARLDLDEDEE